MFNTEVMTPSSLAIGHMPHHYEGVSIAGGAYARGTLMAQKDGVFQKAVKDDADFGEPVGFLVEAVDASGGTVNGPVLLAGIVAESNAVRDATWANWDEVRAAMYGGPVWPVALSH